MKTLFSWIAQRQFWLICLLAVVMFVPFLQNVYVPWHDTMYGFQVFHFFYSNYFYTGELAQWMPNDTFGMPSSHDQLFGISPVNYIAMFLGKMLGVTNALWLFKLCLLVEFLVFLSGLFLLCRLLFKNRLTVFLICLIALIRSHLLFQLYFDFRIMYLLPLVLYWLVRFVREKNLSYLWGTGIILIGWDMGNVLYFVFLWSFVLTVFLATLCWRERGWAGCFDFKNARQWVLLGILLFAGAAFFFQLKDLHSFIDLGPRGNFGRVALGNFIHWGGVYDIGALLHGLVLGPGPDKLVGLFPVALLIYSFFTVRSREHLALTLSALSVLWLAFGGLFSAAAYYFVPLSFYRHIGLTYALLKILVLIAAGFGMEKFWDLSPRKKTLFFLITLAGFIFFVDAFRFSGGWFTELAYTENAREMLWTGMTQNLDILRVEANILGLVLLVLVSAGMALWTLRMKSEDRVAMVHRSLNLIVLFLVTLYSLSYQAGSDRMTAAVDKEMALNLPALAVHPLEYQSRRSNVPLTQRQQQALALSTRPGIDAVYTSAYNFIQLDPCHSEFFTHMHPKAFVWLLNTRKAIDPDLLTVLGCGATKLRLVPQADYVADKDEAARMLFSRPQIADRAVITRPGGRESGETPVKDGTSPAVVTAQDFSANGLEVEVNNPYRPGAWLVYADSFHPDWTVFVNGKKVPCYPAYLAFKAVYLGPGTSEVRFVFRPGWKRWRSQGLALFGGLFGCYLLGILGQALRTRS